VVSEAMRKAIHLTNYRRQLQDKYNKKHNITPETVYSQIKDMGIKTKKKDYAIVDKENIEKQISKLELEMDIAAANMNYELAAELRDQIIELKRGKK
jgi:excinuclease ABC subunit B